jgi:hypothetical protein
MGVFDHEDHEGEKMSVWDELDYDAQMGVFGSGKGRRRVRELARSKSGGLTSENEESPTKLQEGTEVAESSPAMEMDGAMDTPDKVTPTPKSMGKVGKKSAGKKNATTTPSRWHTLASLERSGENGEDGEEV